MDYGGHVDNAIMGGGEPMRADLSITVFLTDPADYDGGELVINSDGAPQPVKLAAGSAIVYLSTSIHKVEKVTRGSRLCGVTWAQSFVRDAGQREMLFELMQLARWARTTAPGSQEAMKVSKLRANLMRLWAEV
jgi:PKHD-type hydroxylase